MMADDRSLGNEAAPVLAITSYRRTFRRLSHLPVHPASDDVLVKR